MDPASGIPFKYGFQGSAVLATSETDEIGKYTFEQPSGAPKGYATTTFSSSDAKLMSCSVFDIVMTNSKGKFYLAVYDTEQVGFATKR